MIHYEDATVTLHHGDCLDVLRELPDASVDAVVTDPPYGLEFMGKDWDGPKLWREYVTESDKGYVSEGRNAAKFQTSRPTYAAGLPFQRWCEQWAAECLRVLKPGGHLLAFGGTRTWHRLACAVEDAGFEVRDSIAWMYGSGFPKSLDVSKAIDKAAGAEREVIGMIPPSVGGGRSAPSHEGWQRPWMQEEDARDKTREITAPATPDAERWQGWGTALKPAFEPIVVARKPLVSPSINVLEMVEFGLRNKGIQGEIRWTKRPANGAAKRAQRTSSSSIEAPSTAEASAAPVGASETQSGERLTASSSGPSTKPGATPTPSTSAPTTASGTASSGTPYSTPTAESVPVAANGSTSSSPSTTSTAAEPLTERQSTARSTPSSDAKDSRPDTESFAGIATGLTGSRTTVHIDRLPDGSFLWPAGLPETVPGGPLTVAANVLAHGTGALNVDGCRVRTSEVLQGSTVGNDIRGGRFASGHHVNPGDIPDYAQNPAGRWPANVILDGAMAEALDEQSGESRSPAVGSTCMSGTSRGASFDGGDSRPTERSNGHGDSGGASRFFYVAKADASERVRVDGIAHPTVKPIALMRWLVRLVTPPGGTVLEPFAGSGTTVEACILEGFRCVAIEREADYLPLIKQRIHRRRDPVEAVRGTGEDMGLFADLDFGGAA